MTKPTHDEIRERLGSMFSSTQRSDVLLWVVKKDFDALINDLTPEPEFIKDEICEFRDINGNGWVIDIYKEAITNHSGSYHITKVGDHWDYCRLPQLPNIRIRHIGNEKPEWADDDKRVTVWLTDGAVESDEVRMWNWRRDSIDPITHFLVHGD